MNAAAHRHGDSNIIVNKPTTGNNLAIQDFWFGERFGEGDACSERVLYQRQF
jgi:hypothetical protein